jgi:two-component system sensor histidine kinase KdpD
VQHLESLNDLVWQLTGVRVKETLPDQVLLEADSLVLILPPRSCSAASRRARSMCPIRPRPPCSPSSPSTT